MFKLRLLLISVEIHSDCHVLWFNCCVQLMPNIDKLHVVCCLFCSQLKCPVSCKPHPVILTFQCKWITFPFNLLYCRHWAYRGNYFTYL